MRRLVYAPKVWIFIRSSNQRGVIYDVSDDIVRGSVTQNLNDVSTARFELRNRYHKWLRNRNNEFRSIFLPMDLCTIWMQRIAGKPVQVFTGYLDSVPYYQAYPGNAIFEATCTLKKLAYNWFDPGLFTWMNWFKDNSEWDWDPKSGGAIAKGAQNAIPDSTWQPSGGFARHPVTDSGLGKLLGQFMIDVAGWAPEDVIIGKMDSKLGDKAAKLYAEIETGVETNLKELSRLMRQFMSVNGPTGHPHRPTEMKQPLQKFGQASLVNYFVEDEKGDRVLTNAATEVVEQVSAAASESNISPTQMVFNAIVMSGLNPEYDQGVGTSSNWGFGLFAMRPNTGSSGNPGSTIPARDSGAGELAIDKMPLDNVFAAGTATRVLANRMNSAFAQGPWVAKAKGGDIDSMVLWLSKALGRTPPLDVDLNVAYLDAARITSQEVAMDPAKQVTPNMRISPNSMTFSEPAIQAKMSLLERSIAANNYTNSKQGLLVPTLLQAKSFSTKLRLGNFPGLRPNEIFITGPPRELQAFYNQIAGDARYESVTANIAGKQSTSAFGVPTRLGGFTRGGGGLEPDDDPTDRLTDFGYGTAFEGIIATLAEAAEEAGGQNGLGTTLKDMEVQTPGGYKWLNSEIRTSLGEGGTSYKQLAAFSANAAFGANFAFPTDFVAAHELTGAKAYMNDTSCLDAVKQFCQASLRAFRSLPDGRFLAFYPDYFSAKRKPYWKIEDIEIIDFGIQLSDDPLATHVYVIGDHYFGANVQPFQNQAASRGVATILHAGIVDTMINWGKTTSGPGYRLVNGLNFVKHYGARPLSYDMSGGVPLIRNSMYEFLLAWQQFMLSWASQFQTACSFTFMPEVMAGGVIEFGMPHGVQMFCNRVTHNFDYTSGFTTEAELMAPALTEHATHRDRMTFPGFALAGGTNTVGMAQ